MKKYLVLLALMFGVSVLWAANESVQRFEVGGSEIYELDSEGDITTSGTITATGAITSSAGLTLGAPLVLYSRTLAQMNALAPSAAGTVIFVSDALQSKLCVSTGTAAGAWVVASATSTAVVGGLLGHCQ